LAAPRRIPLTSAAGAEKNAGEDDEPEPVVIEKLTNAVAVHKIILPFEIEGGSIGLRGASAAGAGRAPLLPFCYHSMPVTQIRARILSNT